MEKKTYGFVPFIVAPIGMMLPFNIRLKIEQKDLVKVPTGVAIALFNSLPALIFIWAILNWNMDYGFLINMAIFPLFIWMPWLIIKSWINGWVTDVYFHAKFPFYFIWER